MSTNKGAKSAMVEQYGNKCMATGVKSKKISYHHLFKAEWGGKSTVENGALVLEAVQQLLHNSFERNDIELFYLANECFQLYKMCLDREETELIECYETEVMPEYKKLLHIPSKRG